VKFCFKLYALHAPQTIWSWSHHFVSFTVGTIRWLTVTEYLCHKMTTDMLRLSQSQYSPRSWLINWFVTRQMPLMEQELINLPEHLSSPSVFNEAYVDRSIVFCAVFCWQLVVLLCFFYCPLYCLSIFDLRVLITPMITGACPCTPNGKVSYYDHFICGLLIWTKLDYHDPYLWFICKIFTGLTWPFHSNWVHQRVLVGFVSLNL
jgi:hypothetical protein